MRILVTGAHGMVGRNILEHPLSQKHSILAPLRRDLDLTNKDQTINFLRKHQPDLIVHAAGRVGGIQANMAYALEFLTENLKLNLNLLEAAVETNIKRLINLSSSCVYPRDQQGLLREDMILTGSLEPTNEGYALAKIAAMKFCEYLQRSNKEFLYKTLIPCNLYGRFDKFDPQHSHLLPAIIHKIHHAKKQNTTVQIWGDGTARREFMTAGDLADALFFALDRLQDLPLAVNIGWGQDHSINEYYEVVARVLDYHGTFSYDLSKPVGMKQKLTDVEKINKLGWRAKTTLEFGIRQAYDYYLTLELAK